MGVDETLLTEIVGRVLSVAALIGLFGSAVTGQRNSDSLVDLLAVEPAPANTRERSVEILQGIGDIGYPVDVIVMRTMRTDRFERTKRVIGGIAYPANKYGRAKGEEILAKIQRARLAIERAGQSMLLVRHDTSQQWRLPTHRIYCAGQQTDGSDGLRQEEYQKLDGFPR